MFEDIAVWAPVSETVAIRFQGFRNLATGQVWIAFANYVGGDESTDADGLIAPEATLDSFLTELPADEAEWRPSIAEAIGYYRARAAP